MTSGDALLGELRGMWTTYDPPPPGLVATMVAAVAAADLDDEWEMLVLLRDSADGPTGDHRRPDVDDPARRVRLLPDRGRAHRVDPVHGALRRLGLEQPLGRALTQDQGQVLGQDSPQE